VLVVEFGPVDDDPEPELVGGGPLVEVVVVVVVGRVVGLVGVDGVPGPVVLVVETPGEIVATPRPMMANR
jgi:hypothetical protein